MLDTYPGTFTLLQIHIGDGCSTVWGNSRAVFYGVGGTPMAWFDGVNEVYGGTGDAGQDFVRYNNAYLAQQAVPTDVTIELVGEEVGTQTYEITATVCIEADGTGKTMRIYIAQVLDRWPSAYEYSRHGFKQAAATEDITLNPGECAQVIRTFTFDADSWADQDNIKIIAWAQEPFSSEPVEVHQAAQMDWPFPEPFLPGDFDLDGDVDLSDFATFALCYAGAAVTTPPPGCTTEEFETTDLDGDLDVDLSDFATFALNYTGAL